MVEPSNKRILVGIDASENAKEALRWALGFAKPGDTIELVNAWTVRAVGSMEAVHLNPATVEVEANKLLRKVASEVMDDDEQEQFDIVYTAVHGQPAESLVNRSEGADLLVVGRRGLGGFRALLLGSVSEALVRHAHCPVVVMPLHD